MTTQATASGSFACFKLQHGLLHGLFQAGQRFRISAWAGGSLSLPDRATHFGFVCTGRAELSGSSGRFELLSGMYFSLPGGGHVGGAGCGLVISHLGYRGLFLAGGPIEATGRLQYIDGCSDTLLIGPVVRGEPCLNLLVLPPGTAQTAHTHPSFRAGVIASGHGHCRLPRGRVPLAPGDAFVIEADAVHSFHTTAEPLIVVAFHPDSDFGPHRDDHPMVNRTIVEGVSAAKLSPAARRIDEHIP